MIGGVENVFEQVLFLAIATTRIAAAFLILPVFAPETVPPLVRNSIFVALGIIALMFQPEIATTVTSTVMWIALFAKEVFVGVAIGFFFATLLWALEAAGQIIDTKVGLAMASIIDPLTGHQTSLTGAFLARLANFVFMFSGGFLVLVGVLLESYALWPVVDLLPRLERAGVTLFENEFRRLITLALLFAAPALVVMISVDIAFGLVNRYAQQLNVFAMSLSIKSWLAVAMLLLMLGTIVEALLAEIDTRRTTVLEVLERAQ